MTMTTPTPTTPPRLLLERELDQVSGGMKWDRNAESKDVIDARGGSFSFLGIIVTFDVNGKVSSVS